LFQVKKHNPRLRIADESCQRTVETSAELQSVLDRFDQARSFGFGVWDSRAWLASSRKPIARSNALEDAGVDRVAALSERRRSAPFRLTTV
jgi:hypothetical protein